MRLKYIEMTPLPHHISKAKKQFELFLNGCIPINDKVSDIEWLAGCVCEQVLHDYFPSPLDYVSKLGHDFETENLKIEVKSHVVKRPPQDHHHFLVSADKIAQIDDDAYLFAMAITPDLKRSWLCGFIEFEKFKAMAKPRKKGEVQGNYHGKSFTYHNDCLEIKYKDLLGFNGFCDDDIVDDEDDDPAPWCHVCWSMTQKGCDCGPVALND